MTLSLPWRIVGHTLLLALCLSILVPLLIALGTAFKPANEVYDLQLWPASPTLDNFRRIFTETPFAMWVWNSTATTVMRVSGQLFIAVITAFAFARWSFRGRDILFAVVLGAMMIPHQLTMIPIYIMVAELRWFDTWQALVIPNLAMPFGVFLLRQHFLQFPRDLFDAAEIDGAGAWRTLWLVVLPNLRPALSALTIILFIETWNEYFWPLLVTDSADSRTIQVGLRQFLEEDYDDYGALMAGITVASLPALAIFFFFQRQVMDTFVASGIKG